MSVENNNEEDVGNEIIVETEVPAGSQTTQSSSDDDDELSSYSNKVQARISRITEKYRKEQRDREEATRVAQRLLEENNQLKSRVQALDSGYLTEYGARLENQEYLVNLLSLRLLPHHFPQRFRDYPKYRHHHHRFEAHHHLRGHPHLRHRRLKIPHLRRHHHHRYLRHERYC